MNCQSYKNQIDETALSAELHRHLESCGDCKTFKDGRECLQNLLGKLEHVNAPANFEFGVKAKLNSLPARSNNRVWTRRFVFATPALAVAAVSAFVLADYNLVSPPQNEPTRIAVQNTNAAPIANLSPSEQTSVATSANSTTIESAPTKQNLPVLNDGNGQVAIGNGSRKQTKRAAPKTDKDSVRGRDVDEPRNSSDEALRPAQTPLIQEEFRQGVLGKVAANEVLSIFGIEKISENGTVESVNSTSKAAEFGIASGDRIETINGQKLAGANLDNSFRQVKIEVVRNGVKRTITMSVSAPK